MENLFKINTFFKCIFMEKLVLLYLLFSNYNYKEWNVIEIILKFVPIKIQLGVCSFVWLLSKRKINNIYYKHFEVNFSLNCHKIII